MIFYWVLFSIPGVFFLIGPHVNVSTNRITWFATALTFIFFVGFRHEVGCDWFSYLTTYEQLGSLTFSEIYGSEFFKRGPAYYFFGALIGRTSLGVYGFNLLCAIFFCWGLFSFCRAQPFPWLACLIAVPYLIIVVSMGYLRQSLAIGFLFFALKQMENGRPWRYGALIFLGSLFHISLVIMFPLILVSFYRKNKKLFSFILVFIVIISFYMFFNFEGFWNTYFNMENSKWLSRGAIPRALMNGIPAAILLLIYYRKSLLFDNPAWSAIAIVSLISVLLVQSGSTGFDRLALYLTPIQLYAWPRIIEGINDKRLQFFLGIFVILVYAAYQVIWLNFSDHMICWVPYLNILF